MAAASADEKGAASPAMGSHHNGKWCEEDEEVEGEVPVKYRGWKAMPYVIGNETFEKLGTIGTSSNLLVYLTTVFHMGSARAATLLNVWTGTTNIATLAGAFLCDAFFGRYKTLGFACVSSFLGMVVLTLTAAVGALHPGRCAKTATTSCPGPTEGQLAFLLLGLGLLVVGAGGIRPCNLAFGADQFDPRTAAGKRGINSFFNWYYFTFTVAMMVSATVIIFVQSSVSWSLGLAIPAGLMLLSCAFFFIGSPVYVKVRPEGSPFTGAARVVAAAVRKRGLRLPVPGEKAAGAGGGGCGYYDPPLRSKLLTKLQRTDQFRVLDKAAIVTDPKADILPDGSAANPWALCSLQQVEEVKCILRVLPIWLSNTMYATVSAQQTTYVVFQALQSDRHLGGRVFEIPAGSFVVFTMLTLTLWIPVYDRLVVPRLRRLTGREGGITMLQRMGVGNVLIVVSMLMSVAVERRRRAAAPAAAPFPLGLAPSGGAVSEMPALWLAPQLAMMGLSEGFTVIGVVEFYYKQFPENMRSVAGSFMFCAMAVSHYVSGLMITVVNRVTARGGRGESWLAGDLNKGKLDYYYLLTAGIAVINFGYFLICASWYKYKGGGADAAANPSVEDDVKQGEKPMSEVALAPVNGNHKTGSAAGNGALPEP